MELNDKEKYLFEKNIFTDEKFNKADVEIEKIRGENLLYIDEIKKLKNQLLEQRI